MVTIHAAKRVKGLQASQHIALHHMTAHKGASGVSPFAFKLFGFLKPKLADTFDKVTFLRRSAAYLRV